MNKDTAERVKRLKQEVKDLGRNPKDYRYDYGAMNAWRRSGAWVYILIPNNREAIVNWTDFVEQELYHKRWANSSSNPLLDYPHTNVLSLDDKPKKLYLHHAVMGAKTGCVIDHINGDHYDCRSWNLRHGTTEQNNQNRHPRPKATGSTRKNRSADVHYVQLL
jgi:hypothetical protein